MINTIEKEYCVLNKGIYEKQTGSFSEEDYYGFIKKLKPHEKEPRFIPSTPFLDKIIQSYKSGLPNIYADEFSEIEDRFEKRCKEILSIQEKKAEIEIESYSFEKAKGFYSDDTSQKEVVEYEMTIYNPNYTPTERELYNQLTPEEKKEWNTLSPEDKQFNLECMGPEGKKLLKTMDSVINKIENLRLFGI